MLNEHTFIKSAKCPRKAWIIENIQNTVIPKPSPFPDIIKGKKNVLFHSALGEATVDCVIRTKNGIKLYDFHDTVKFGKYSMQINYKRAVAESCGYRVSDAFAVTINPLFEKGRNKPFYIFNRIEKPKSKTEFIRCIKQVAAAASAKEMPEPELKNSCAGCEFFKNCFKLPKNNIFTLKGINFSDKVKLYKDGIITFDDYMQNNPSPFCRMQITGETHTDKNAIKAFLNNLKYPLGFLDFETISPAEPIFDGYHPGDKIITQFSYHLRNKKSSAVTHSEFIGDGITNPEPLAVKALISATESAKSVLAYSSYEKNCIEMLSERYPEYRSELKILSSKIADLEIPFRQHMYYNPLMKGRTSLKVVLPALYPDDTNLDYHKLNVSDGEAAINAYMSLSEKTNTEREKIKSNLKKYCSLDTLALVKITDKLYELAE